MKNHFNQAFQPSDYLYFHHGSAILHYGIIVVEFSIQNLLLVDLKCFSSEFCRLFLCYTISRPIWPSMESSLLSQWSMLTLSHNFSNCFYPMIASLTFVKLSYDCTMSWKYYAWGLATIVGHSPSLKELLVLSCILR